MTTQEVTIRKLIASDGMVITDVKTQMMRSAVVYLGCEDSESNYIEIAADTPLPTVESEE